MGTTRLLWVCSWASSLPPHYLRHHMKRLWPKPTGVRRLTPTFHLMPYCLSSPSHNSLHFSPNHSVGRPGSGVFEDTCWDYASLYLACGPGLPFLLLHRPRYVSIRRFCPTYGDTISSCRSPYLHPRLLLQKWLGEIIIFSRPHLVQPSFAR
ncbi:unnamed protein product [Protopolystoma xenopodis]|uniref:Uncharacterized protein n=1 Tax=Protopolystoma xenopodis TaxID=117903 RepID=A0A3S5CNZ5_9PLAT|nr:unnamed protein product [Protopolystoma xenopodis]